MATGALNFLAKFNYHLQVATVLLNFVVKDALAALALQLNILLNILKVFFDCVDFHTPLKWIKLRF